MCRPSGALFFSGTVTQRLAGKTKTGSPSTPPRATAARVGDPGARLPVLSRLPTPIRATPARPGDPDLRRLILVGRACFVQGFRCLGAREHPACASSGSGARREVLKKISWQSELYPSPYSKRRRRTHKLAHRWKQTNASGVRLLERWESIQEEPNTELPQARGPQTARCWSARGGARAQPKGGVR